MGKDRNNTGRVTSDERRAGALMLRVRRIVRAITRSVPDHVDRDDVLGAAYVGLAEALAKLGPEGHGPTFEAYALLRTRGAITDHLRTHDVLTRSQRVAMRRLTQIIGRLAASLGRMPTEDEIVAAAGSLEGKQVRATLTAAGTPRRFTDAEETLADDGIGPELLLLLRRDEESVRRALQGLPPRLRRVLELYYFDDVTLREIGEELGVSEGRVSQLRKQALDQLKAGGTLRRSTRPPPRLAATRPGPGVRAARKSNRPRPAR